jgi:hypothetical protein
MLLRAEMEDRHSLSGQLSRLISAATSIWKLDPATKNSELLKKETAQKILVDELKPPAANPDELRSLLHATKSVCKL